MMINVKIMELLVGVVDINAVMEIPGINQDVMVIIVKLDIILTHVKINALKIAIIQTKKVFSYMRIILIKFLIFIKI